MIRTVFFAALLSLSLYADAITDAAEKKVAQGKYEEAVADLDAAYKKNPKSAVYKKALADAYFAHANVQMNARKYRVALPAFRKAAQLDPKNIDAAAKVELIEGIYKQMGMPIPK